MSSSFIHFYNLTFTFEIQTEDKGSVKRGCGLRYIKGCSLDPMFINFGGNVWW